VRALDPLAWFGRQVLALVAEVGALAMLALRTVRATFTSRFEGREMLRQAQSFGVGSLLVLGTTAALVGGIMVVQAGLYVRRFGVQELVGWFAGFGVLRDVGPLVAGLVFSGRVGSRNAAELASMTTRDQLEGLRAIGVDAIPVVVAPRAVAMVFSLVTLYFVGSAISIGTAAVSAGALLDVDFPQFSRSFLERTSPADLASGALKCVVFALAVALISCRAGLAAKGGATAVGEAAKRAVVRAALAIVVLDLAVSRVV
jgi:phospholipid/cholesterol/gamma-HCH transport system permease protein